MLLAHFLWLPLLVRNTSCLFFFGSESVMFIRICADACTCVCRVLYNVMHFKDVLMRAYILCLLLYTNTMYNVM